VNDKHGCITEIQTLQTNIEYICIYIYIYIYILVKIQTVDSSNSNVHVAAETSIVDEGQLSLAV